ncbi:amidohydrolase [Pontibacter sp. G13]|uniref:M20 metallopeptidase family protein n=1 Tax=Pontibacter sp. G13 TaxID=3074898 RepID=UPI00288B9A9A|nr:amidohydrolase [Pontibacter sp. G13]WNJ21484.1 amidohydrolase [Pontibacter sp. G13]
MAFLNRICLAIWLFSLSSASVAQIPMQAWLDEEMELLTETYQYLHQHPELSFHEEKTSQFVAQKLEDLGFEVKTGIGGHGVVAILSNGEGPTIMVRADMDALPIVEETGVSYASQVSTEDGDGNTVGVMHACGHDMHMTVGLGTMAYLANHLDTWKGTLMFVGQPAEEVGSGARLMIAEGLFENFPIPDQALALHVSASLPAGSIGFCPNYAMANVDMMDITVYGNGGHGAYPHTTIDPVVLSARLILDLQTIVSREISPLDPAVVTVGSIHGGSKGNVIPNEVKLQLTLRSYKPEVREAIIAKIKRICRAAGASAGLPEAQYPLVELRNEFTPALFNDPQLTASMVPVFQASIGEENVKQVSPVMAGEDFGRYGKTDDGIPILLYWLGAVPPTQMEQALKGELVLPSLHSSKFLPDYVPCILTGVKSMTAAVMALMNDSK